MSNSTTKQCTKCLEIFPATNEYFSPDNRTAYGLQSQCRFCKRQYAREYRAQYPERKSRAGKKYHAKHRQEDNLRSKEWYIHNIDRRLQYRKKHRSRDNAQRNMRNIANPEKVRKQHREWRKNNPEKARAKDKRNRAYHPTHLKAREAVHAAVKSKKMPHPNTMVCCCCGNSAQEYHHWHGYDRKHWLDVVPVCRKCHRNLS